MTEPTHKKRLNRIIWRSRLKSVLQLAGILLAVVGVMFVFPKAIRHHGKTTIFDWIVSLGTFDRVAIILIGAGAVTLVASFLIRGDSYEEP